MSHYDSDLKHMSAGAIVYDDSTETYLLVRGPVKWSFPKGHGKKGETYTQCAIREVKEETNVDIIIDKNSHYMRCLGTKLYLVIVDKSAIDPKINDNVEVVELRWFTLDDMLKEWDKCNSLIKNFILSKKYLYFSKFNNIQ